VDDSGFPEDTRQSSYDTGNICIDVKGRWTVTGACGPYNLGGSATVPPIGDPAAWVPRGSEREGVGALLWVAGLPGHLGRLREREKGEGEGRLD